MKEMVNSCSFCCCFYRKLKAMDFQQQQSWRGKCVLVKALENLFVEYCDVNVKQSYQVISDPQINVGT